MNKKGQDVGVAVTVTVIAFILALILVVAGFDSVPAGHVGVRQRLGVISDTYDEAGIRWTGIMTSTIKFSTRIQLYEYDVNAFSTDAQVVKTQVALNFRIDPASASELYKNIGENYQDVIIAPIVQETVKANTAKYNLDELVKNREAVKNAITVQLTQKLADKGLIVTEVALTNFEFSDEVQNAIENKQVASQNALAEENNLKAMQYEAEAMKLQTEVIEIKKLDLQLAEIEVQRTMAEKWDGSLPATMVVSDGNEMLLNLGGLM